MNKNVQYDIIVLLGPNRLEQLQKSIILIKKHLRHKNIKVIASAELQHDIEKLGCMFVCEDKVLDGLNFASVAKIMNDFTGSTRNTGWYFQQFLKMAYALQCQDDYYLIWDADTIPGKDIEFIEPDGVMLFNLKSEHHKPYFQTIDTLFGGSLKLMTRKVNPSFISEGMIIKKEIMIKLIGDIEANNNLDGTKFWEKIMGAISSKNIQMGGFSEFETYGSYMLTYWPELWRERPLKTERFGYSFFGRMLTDEEIESSGYDTISFEDWDKNRRFKRLFKWIIMLRRKLRDNFGFTLYDFD